MIVGVLSHLEVLSDNLCKQINAKLNSNFQRISSLDWSQCMNVGVVVNSSRKFELLQRLEKIYGNILVSGNLFLDYDVRSQIANSGGKVVLISIPKTDEEKSNNTFASPKPKLNSQDLIIFVAQDYPEEVIEKFKESIKDRKDVVNMSIEDSIKKAMMELGIEPDEVDSPSDPEEKLTLSNEVDEEISLEDYPDPEDKTQPEPLPEPSDSLSEVSEKTEPINPTAEIPKTEIIQQKSNLDVYLKMKDGTMVLFIPADFEFETQVVEGTKYSTIVFKAPDLGNTGLQKLNVTRQNKSQVVTAPKTVVKKLDVTNMNLESLVKEKSSLDHQIKDARSKGDEELVKQLRKQRRHVREQINLWGDEP